MSRVILAFLVHLLQNVVVDRDEQSSFAVVVVGTQATVVDHDRREYLSTLA